MAVAAPGDMNGDGLADVAVSFVDPNPDAGQLDELDTGAVNFLFGTRGSPRDLRLRATAEGMRQVILGAALRRSREEFEAAVRARSDITIGPCDSEWVPTIELYEPGTRFWRAIESALKTPVPEDHRLRRLGDASGKTVFELLADGSGLLRVDSFSVATGRIRHPRECVDCPPCSSTEGAE